MILLLPPEIVVLNVVRKFAGRMTMTGPIPMMTIALLLPELMTGSLRFKSVRVADFAKLLPGSQIPDTPIVLFFPVSVLFPGAPIVLELLLRNVMVTPGMPLPPMSSEIVSPG